MKSFLAKIGVLEKESEVTSVVEVKPEPIVVEQKSSRFVTTEKVVDVQLDPEKLDKKINELYTILSNEFVELQSLFEFTNACNKLGRIADLRTRYLTALDISGIKVEDLLAAAEKYENILDSVRKSELDKFSETLAPKGESISAKLRELHQKQDDLDKQLNIVSNEINVLFAEEESINKEVEFESNLYNAAFEKLNSEFSGYFQQVKSNIK